MRTRFILLELLVLATLRCHPRGAPGADPGSSTADAGPAHATGHMLLVEPPASGSVQAIVHDAMARGAREGRRLIVYVGATWCEPCQGFHSAAASGELDAAFPDVTLVVFDLDRDGERLTQAGYVSKYIPLFAVPASDGSASGRQVEGAIKGPGALAFIVPRLRALLAP